MRYRTLPFACVLDQGFAAQGGAAALAGKMAAAGFVLEEEAVIESLLADLAAT